MSKWRVSGGQEDVWIAASHAPPTEKLVHLFTPSVAAWRVDEWLGPLAARGALLEIASYLGEPAANGGIQESRALRARVGDALREGRLIAYRREEVVYAVPVQQIDDKPRQVQKTEQKTWVGIQLVDDDGNPVKFKKYRITLPDNSVTEGMLDENGFARVNGIDAGSCKVEFPDFDGASWAAA
jgi:hypothetical protein